MKVSRHIHFLENPTTCIRHEYTFDPPHELLSTLGKVDLLYPDVDFTQDGNNVKALKVDPIINQNGLLHVRELMSTGEVLSIEVRAKHRFDRIVFEDTHELEPQATNTTLMYVFYIGKSGMVVITGKLVTDDDGFFQLLKGNLKEPAIRKYIHQRSSVNGEENLSWYDLFPDVMSHRQAALFLHKSESWLYDQVACKEIRRTRNNRYLKKNLIEYLEASN